METKDYSRNAKEVWEEVKSIFSDNPEEALKQCSLDLKKIANYDPKEGHSLYVGNCVITKKCVKAVHKFMGITDELEFMSSSNDNKHHIEFWIGRKAKCTFHEGRAKACCYTDIENTIKVFFSYFYPEEYITIEK